MEAALLATVLDWYEHGGCPVPVAVDRSKRPAIAWREFQDQRPTRDELIKLFEIDSDGVGLVCGEVSGRLEMVELEGLAVDRGLGYALVERLKELELFELWQRIVAGYLEATPRNGLHTLLRTSDGAALPNTVLAATADHDVLIETRGEGGFTVVAPSSGRSHPNGGAWQLVAGGPSTVAVITSDERDDLYAALAEFDQRVRVVSEPQSASSGLDLGERPGDVFNAAASWADVLGPHGWTLQRVQSGVCYWRKPDKRKPGCSATTGRDEHDRLFVFSTSTEFEPGKPYSKFSAYALLEHGGDYGRAAAELRRRGYGGQSEPLTLSDAGGLVVAQIDAGDAPDVAGDLLDADAIDLEELFWTSRPVLGHLRAAAYARVVSPWAVFGCAVLRVLCTVPPWVVLPPLIGGDGSLNAFVALVGPPGSGKSSAMSCARAALRFDAAVPFPTIPLGSGEGLVRTFREYDVKAKAQVELETSALFVADEVDTLRALFERSGSTLGGQLKSAYVAGYLGFANANRERRVWLEEHSYRLCLLVGVQPGKSQALFADTDGGTPARFVWLPTLDARHPDERPAWPTPLTLSSQQWNRGRVTLSVPGEVVDEIVTVHREAQRGDRDPLDGHALFAREKIAQALTLLDGRRVMTLDDWGLAGIVMYVSNRTRSSALTAVELQRTQQGEARAQSAARTAVVVDQRMRESSVERIAARVLIVLQSGPLSAGVLRAKIAKRDRDQLDDAIEVLITRGRVVADDTKQGGRLLSIKH